MGKKLRAIRCSCCGEFPTIYALGWFKYQLKCRRRGNDAEECIRPAAKYTKKKAFETWNNVHRWWRAQAEEYFLEHGVAPPWAPKLKVRVKKKEAIFNWRNVLGNCKTLSEAKDAYRRAAKSAHPDRGGSHVKMTALNVAWDLAQKEFDK